MKNIVLLSDGTGNSAAKVWRTNIWRLFQYLELKGSNQIAIYDDGVGTSSFLPLAILGGLKRNVRELYKFLCRNYQLRDRIYGFGFSRGAFTIRVLIRLVLNQGLVNFSTEAELDKKARAAYRAYRHAKYPRLNLQFPIRLVQTWLDRRFYKSCERRIDEIEFLGLWDTVAAYALPVDEMTRGVNNWIWSLELPSTVCDLTEALHQQTATADVLKVISSSPGELQPVFQTLLEKAVHLCEAEFAMLFLYEENEFRAVGKWNLPARL